MAIGADNAGVEAYVSDGRSPLDARLHITTLRDLGVYLIEHVDLEALARDAVYTFLFIAAPKLARTYNAFARKTTRRRVGPIYVVDPSGI